MTHTLIYDPTATKTERSRSLIHLVGAEHTLYKEAQANRADGQYLPGCIEAGEEQALLLQSWLRTLPVECSLLLEQTVNTPGYKF